MQIALSLLTLALAGAPEATTIHHFDRDPENAPPPGFTFGRTGDGKAGKWVVLKDPTAPTAPAVLAQVDDDDTDFRSPIAVADAPVSKDVAVSVRCKPISGKVDQACGLVARYQDENNYYVTRANPLESNVRLYFVKDGNRQQIASWRGVVRTGQWHELALEIVADRLAVSFDGKKVIEQRDATFGAAGRAGVWTKADSVTHFDDLRIDSK